MTAVDHAELKRVAEGATPGPWEYTGDHYNDEGGRFSEIVSLSADAKDRVIIGESGGPHDYNPDFIAAANPAVVLALLSEIEGLKAERKGLINAAEARNSLLEITERQLAALRTQASDSWGPIAEHDNSADEVLVTVEGRRKPIVAWRHHPSSRTDKWLSVPGNYRVYPTAFHPLPALRPQTAESGDA